MHAPARVAVVWSKISIAERVPVTVAFAVAVRTTFWSGLSELAFEVRRTRGWSAGESVQIGTLGVTGAGTNVLPTTLAGSAGRGAGRAVSLDEGGAGGPGVSGGGGEGPRP